MGDEDSPFVDNVVVQGDDNEYYLDHNLNGDYSKTGTVFADYREKITAENTPANIILYGHNVTPASTSQGSQDTSTTVRSSTTAWTGTESIPQ